MTIFDLRFKPFWVILKLSVEEIRRHKDTNKVSHNSIQLHSIDAQLKLD
jgi:hypothetical protein